MLFGTYYTHLTCTDTKLNFEDAIQHVKIFYIEKSPTQHSLHVIANIVRNFGTTHNHRQALF